MLGVNDILSDEEKYITIKLNKSEIRLIELAIADKVLENKKRLEKVREKDEIATANIEFDNTDYLQLLQILKYVER